MVTAAVIGSALDSFFERERSHLKLHRRRQPGNAAAARNTVELFAAAVRQHQAGHLGEAEGGYRRILAIDPQHSGSLHNLGLLALQTGRCDLGADTIARAVALNDRVPDWHYNLAFALSALGRGAEAIAHYRKAVALKPDYVEAHMNLGNALKAEGQTDPAIACYRQVIALRPGAMEAHYNVANVFAEQGRWAEAAEAYERALVLKPDLAQAHTNLGIVLAAQAKLGEAAARHRQALALDPNLVEAHVNLGKVLAEKDRREEAVACYRRALAIDPNHAAAHNNLGVILMADGKLDAAIASYQRAVALRPDLSEAHNNLGIMFAVKGETIRAAECYRQALAIKPDFVEAYNNLGRVFAAERDMDQALRVLARALAIRETTETKTLFVECLKSLRSVPGAADHRDLVVRALSEPWGRPSDIAQFAAGLIMQSPEISGVIARTRSAWPRRLAISELLAPATRAVVARDRLLQALLSSSRIADSGLERFLTVLRAGLLTMAADTPEADAIDTDELQLYCTLARQCFVNDYVFDVASTELAQAKSLRRRLIAALETNASIPVLQLVAVAAYFPLHSLPSPSALLAKSWPDAVAPLLLQQVREPDEERQYRVSIPQLTAIEDTVSLLVQEQYEQNPYPRWVKPAAAPNPITFDDYLRRLFPVSEFHRLGKHRDVEVLVAGCGTGQHSVEIAQRWTGTRVLAVDLSLTSLCYAKRQTERLGLDNIDYAQADILKLEGLGRTFDVIEAAGVLHHLADPQGGWRVLSSLLRPGGFLFIGLYSSVARRDIVDARHFIAGRGYRPTIDDIRRCRQELMDAGEGTALRNVTKTADFGSASECRDLLFHVQEHRTCLPEIKAALAENQLTFLGFEIDPFIRRQYGAHFPDDRAMTDLDRWHDFERENPLTFARMYQFWAQKT